ncbi:hypothetical protein C8A00DRAFT_44735 [Chaetomidium leptoderma]|uniref:DUF4238 domain-containing protein n=1 Tax=Chaetomidium leptoderma TaxID=669021 RepID=A0AAN6ZV71_9PEZI|nr:hypothetical protein C8A00DRAFT_44735 [Chaetomidium leptoderma]
METTPNPQYQHFVPQFLLQNFAHPYKPDGDSPKKRKGGGKRKYQKGMYPKDPVVRNLDLVAEPPVICEKPVKRILGQMNMYQDTSQPTKQQQHVEEMLSKLEARASAVVRKITKAFEEKEAGLWLMRSERDLLRKFLFVLKYRGDGFRHRFFHQNPEDYSENDKELVRAYMDAHGFKRPLDVWFHNLQTIIESERRCDQGWAEWVLELRKRMYPEDAMWFASHDISYYMAICTPSDVKDEFILTDNSYNIFEGPNHFVQDVHTGEVGAGSYTPLHEFAPISPKLMIVLRCSVLPNPLEDANKDVKAARAANRFLALDSVYPYEVKSMLADLPIDKARNNYSQVIDGRIRSLSGEDGRAREDHKFCFSFFPISSDHVHTINSILLDNTSPCSSVVFESQESFARTLEWYLTAPCTVGKIITGPDTDLREATLRKLERVSRELGSDKEMVFKRLPTTPIADYEGFRLRHLDRLQKMSRGSADTLMFDAEQSRNMWRLRTAIDAWSKGKVDESIRQRNRELLLDAYFRLPPRRVWLFVKYARYGILSLSTGLKMEDMLASPGPEDAVVRAHRIVLPDRLARLLFISTTNDIEKKRRPWLDLWDPLKGGSIEALTIPSGIPEVQELAHQAQLEILKTGRYDRQAECLQMFDEGEKIELLTRLMVRERFVDAVKGKLEMTLLLDLKKTLFETTYPTPPPSWQRYFL